MSVNEASGCHVTGEDFPHIVGTLACCLCFLVYGASAASLGAALPSMADDLGKSSAQLGIYFTARGIGYTIGTLGSAYILHLPRLLLSKEMMTCLAILLTGIATGIIEITASYLIAIPFFIIQGVGFGGIDTMANCALPEMWQKRAQPWMQAMHSCFGVGAIIGPAIVGAKGFHFTFFLISICSFVPLIALIMCRVVDSCLQTGGSWYEFFGDASDDSVSSRHPGIRFELDDDEEHTSTSTSTSVSHNYNDKPSDGKRRSDPADIDSATQDNTHAIAAPLYLKLVMTSFFFLYVGVETGFAGWIPAYALDQEITADHAKAAYLSAIFWAALTIGRLLSIPAAVFCSSTVLIRLQLVCAVCSCLLAVSVMTVSYSVAAVISGCVGFSLSSMFPVMLTLIDKYGFKSEASTTTMLIVGATLGESAVPVLMGWLMLAMGSVTMPVFVLFSCLLLVVIYWMIHLRSTKLVSSHSHQQVDNDADNVEMTELSENSQHPMLLTHSASSGVMNPISSGHEAMM